jgi:hypothetical protein
MNFSLLPTDNLYKFAALMGLTGLFALVFVLPNTIASRFQEKYFKALREADTFEAQRRGFDETMRILNLITTAPPSPAEKGEDKPFIFYSQDEIKAMMREAIDQSIKQQTLVAEIKVLVKEMEAIDRERQRFYILLIVGGVFFAAMTVWGFWNWRKIQMLADERLEIELADLKKKH